MGQRHQLFVIARVGKHYRSLAAVHHQWLYGVSALRSCLRLLRIFSDPGNRLALKHELDLAVSFFKDKPPPSEPEEYQDAESTTCPFPFITTCLAIGASYDSKTGQVQAIHELRYDMGYDQGDNNDGITVIDVTDLDHVRYCFVNFGSGDIYAADEDDADPQSEFAHVPHAPHSDNPATETPLTGREYLRGYYSESDEMVQRNTEVIEALDNTPLVEEVALARAWPWGGWKDEAKLKAAEPLHNAQDVNTTKSLRDMAAAKLFDRLLTSINDDFDPSLLDEVRNFPGFQRMVKEYLICHPEKVGPTQASAHLLQLAYAGEECLEWNLFTKLDPKTIKAALTSDALKGATGISLTALQNSEPAELLAALSSLDRLHTLQALDRPDREDEGASNRLFDALAESDHHLALKKLTLTGLYANGIRQNIWRPYRDHPKTLPAFPVVQLLVSHEGKDSGFVASSELQLESFYLGDAPLPPTRFINGLFQYIASQVLCLLSYNGTGLQCAHCFSCGPSALGEDKSSEITALPAEAYAIAKGSYHSSAYKGVQSKLRDLTRDGWMAVVSKKSDTEFAGVDSPSTTRMRFKYAFVRSNATIQVDQKHWRGSDIQPAELEVVDMKEFLHKTTPEADTSKLAYHVSNLEDTLVQATRARTIVTTPDEEPLFSSLSPDEACVILNKFVSAMPQVQKTVARGSRWGIGEDAWISKLGFDADEKD
ncbi:hypothetical protein NCS54_00970600 [Fusarium falciforme]|uniref:uncharacterized protein n=1 Tax=Fusarium falciforme TaxID=195108 RepID=UPI0023007734|nr:uncharacterized protein NCS54_00970600 [Fusarium falciforme]WAO92210.1 hypothetical protein NCS54_00970600 [Fusarium falciforme]